MLRSLLLLLLFQVESPLMPFDSVSTNRHLELGIRCEPGDLLKQIFQVRINVGSNESTGLHGPVSANTTTGEGRTWREG
jgi:hypothetical protein